MSFLRNVTPGARVLPCVRAGHDKPRRGMGGAMSARTGHGAHRRQRRRQQQHERGGRQRGGGRAGYGADTAGGAGVVAALPEIGDKIRSMGGWTAETLGQPTRDWLNG